MLMLEYLDILGPAFLSFSVRNATLTRGNSYKLFPILLKDNSYVACERWLTKESSKKGGTKIVKTTDSTEIRKEILQLCYPYFKYIADP